MKQIARKALNSIGFDVRRIPKAPGQQETLYVRHGRIPWSAGYDEAKEAFIVNALGQPDLMELFRSGATLPSGYGFGLDERCIEYPWVLSRLPSGFGQILDAGSSLNFLFLIQYPPVKEKHLHIVTLGPELNCFWTERISYLYEDLRALPMRDELYDDVICISTLEHVGMDNGYYSSGRSHAEHRTDDFVQALLEMRRVLKRGGRLFITVPYGKYCDFGTFQQFDRRLVDRVLSAINPHHAKTCHYRYTTNGWNVSTASECADAEYVDWIMRPRDTRPQSFPDHPDRAAAARAVACLELVR